LEYHLDPRHFGGGGRSRDKNSLCPGILAKLTNEEVMNMSKKSDFSCLLIFFTIIAVLSSPGFAFDTTVKNDIQELMDSWVAMWNSYDLKMVDKLFLQDSRVSYFSSEKEGLIQGIDAVRKHHAGFGFVDGGKIQENKLWVDEIQLSDFETTAVVAGIWYFQRESNDAASVQKGPFTFVCVRQGQEWRLAHLNFSEYK
jgi:ketosteroid isomerase-like protein